MFNDLKDPYVIIGMHRSGTSFLSRVLHNRGIFMGVNQTGVNEARFFLKKNKAVLKANGLRFDKPGTLTDLSSVSFKEGEFKRKFLGYPFKRGPVRQVIKENGDWGWKDPRNTLTLPYWKQFFPGMKVIHIYRNGLDVALSFQKRNLNVRKGSSYYSEILNDGVGALKLWEQYFETAESYREEYGKNFLTIKYEELIGIEQRVVTRFEDFIGRDIKEYLQQNADRGRVNKNDLGELKDTNKALYDTTMQSNLMKELGYLL